MLDPRDVDKVPEEEWEQFKKDAVKDELYYNGTAVQTPFDGLLAFSDATLLWGLNESTLRKAIAYGKLVNGRDVSKFGKQWVVPSEAMRREYGSPKN